METTTFTILHKGILLGKMLLSGNRITFKGETAAFPYLESQPGAWLMALQPTAKRLCRELGHSGPAASAKDAPSGIEVAREI